MSAANGRKFSSMAEVGSTEHKPLGLVWLECPHSVIRLGLEGALNEQAQLHIGREAPKDAPNCVILCVNGPENLTGDVRRLQELNPDAPVLVFGPHLNLRLASAALRSGASGFIHAEMTPGQMVHALAVVIGGEGVAPRRLLRYLVSREDSVDLDMLSVRQREILELVVEGFSNAQIAERLFLAETTVKQHLRAAYKRLGVSSRTQAARLISSGG
jgi:DNA-binding NarL/FixJ family response regulator